MVTDPQEILGEEVTFYRRLYANKGISLADINTYLDKSNVTHLTEEENNLCEGIVTLNECYEAIKKMKLNKAPGCDGLTVEFYKFFWEEIKQIVCNAINDCYLKNEMSNTQKRGVITLLYKKGDKQLLENWHPITLLNTNYKMLTKIIM